MKFIVMLLAIIFALVNSKESRTKSSEEIKIGICGGKTQTACNRYSRMCTFDSKMKRCVIKKFKN